MQGRNVLKLVIVIPLVLLIGAGCSRYKPRSINIEEGEYYEDEEYQKLSGKDREAYCATLASELERLQSRSEQAQQDLTENKEKIRTLTKELRDAEREYSNLTTHIDELTKQIEELEGLPKTWTFQYGECLWTVAGYEEVYGDPLRWPRLWRGNTDMIEDPDWVLAGWEIKVPRDWPKRHRVIQDEWLAKIAGYWEVYDNYKEWPVLYEANKGGIQDPDLIFPDQELVIPR
jgi:nucleoid-associated protein YgaU